ncbi:MAG TPA: GtrA family protein [Spongiibacteraceae bacterium]|nr:GtrA family protein [Spongiibacteraceae bacterium]
MKLAVIYALLAAIATVFNIGSQDVAIRLYSGAYSVTLSILVGTGVGLLMKYILDKRYIFQFKAKNAAHDAQTFVLYTLMGVITTVIFWGFEYGFEYLFHTKEARYIGGVIGLAIGYFVKYRLDKRFVFRLV